MGSENKFYRAFCGDLCRNFDKSWSDVGAKLDFAFQYLRHVPDECWRMMVPMAIERWERWPTNWTKAVMALFKDTHQAGANVVVYDPIEDLRFPVGLMQRAFSILMHDGYPAYHRYVTAVRMPKNDRDRVECKARICRSGDNQEDKVNHLISDTIPGDSQRCKLGFGQNVVCQNTIDGGN